MSRGSYDSEKVDSSNCSFPDTSEGEVIGEELTVSGATWNGSVRTGRLFGAEKIRLAPLWVGRDDLLTKIKDDLINGCQVLSLCGQRGIGKTSLAVKLLEVCGVGITDKTLAVDCPFDRVVYVQVSEQMSFNSVIEDLAKWLQIQLKPGLIPDQLISVLITRLKRSRCLIVLDNLEALLKAGQTVSVEWGKLLRALVNSDYKSQILITNLDTSNKLLEPNNSNNVLNPPTVKVRLVIGISRDDSVRLLRAKGLEDSDEDLYWVADQTHGHVGALLLLSSISKSKYSGFLRKNPSIVTNHINTFNDVSADITNSKISKWLRIQQRFKIQKSQSLKPWGFGLVHTLQRGYDRLERSKSVLNLTFLRTPRKWQVIVNLVVVLPKLTRSVASKKLPTWMRWTSCSIMVLELLGIVGFQYYNDNSIQIQDKKLREQTAQFEQDLKSVQQLKKDLKNKNYASVLKESLPRNGHLKAIVQRLRDIANTENLKATRQLEKAQAFLKQGDIQAAIDIFRQIPRDTDSYPVAQKTIEDINQKAKKAFLEAEALEKQNELAKALKLLNEIPQGISIPVSAQYLRNRIEKKMGDLIDPTQRAVTDSSTRSKVQQAPEAEQAREPNFPEQYQPKKPAPPAQDKPVEPPVQATPNQQTAPDPPRDTHEESGFGR